MIKNLIQFDEKAKSLSQNTVAMLSHLLRISPDNSQIELVTEIFKDKGKIDFYIFNCSFQGLQVYNFFVLSDNPGGVLIFASLFAFVFLLAIAQLI